MPSALKIQLRDKNLWAFVASEFLDFEDILITGFLSIQKYSFRMAALRLSFKSLPSPTPSSTTPFQPPFNPIRLAFPHCIEAKCREIQVRTKQNNGHHKNVSARASLATDKKYSKIGVQSTGKLSASDLLDGVEAAAKRGAEVVMEAVNKPRNIDYKGKADLVTDTDRRSELAILEVVRENFKNHLILGEEGGVTGDSSSEYLWCIDPLDGTTNFAHGYPSFGVSVGVLYRGRPAAAAVVEFAGGPHCWVTRSFSASAGHGAFCNGQQIHVSSTDQVERSLLVTGFGYDHDEAWATNMDLFKEFTDISRGVRRLGAAAVDMCHVAFGMADAYWEYRLKPWDMAAGALIVEEAGGSVTCMDGGDFCVFDRSVLVSNGTLHENLLERIAPRTEKLIQNGMDVSRWFKPKEYESDV